MRISEYANMLNGMNKVNQALTEPFSQLRQRQPADDVYGSRVRELESMWRNANRQLLDLRDKAAALSTKEAWSGRTASTTHADLVTATASSEAATGSHDVVVSQLAQAETVSSKGYWTGASALGLSGTFKVNDKTVTVAGTDDLWDIATKIKDSGADVSASVNKASDGTYRLEITSGKTGTAGTASLLDGAQGVLSSLGVLDATGRKASTVNAARDARVTFDGQEYTSSTNVVTAQGVTLSLVKASQESVKVNVANNDDRVVGSVRAFADSYNRALDQLGQYQTSAAFTDSAKVQRFRSEIVTLAQEAVPELAPDRSRLSYLGLSFESGGKLRLDEAKLRDRLSQDREGVTKLFAAPQGIAGRFDMVLTGLTQQAQSLVPQPDASGLRQLVGDEFRKVTGYLDAREAKLLTQAQVLEQTLAGLQSSQTDLFTRLSSLTSSTLL